MTTTQIRQLVATEVGRAVSKAIPEIITAIQEQLEAAIDERVKAAIGAAQQHHHQQESSRRPSASLRPQWGDAGGSSSNPSPASSPSVTVVEHDEVVHIVRRGRCHATGYW